MMPNLKGVFKAFMTPQPFNVPVRAVTDSCTDRNNNLFERVYYERLLGTPSGTLWIQPYQREVLRQYINYTEHREETSETSAPINTTPPREKNNDMTNKEQHKKKIDEYTIRIRRVKQDIEHEQEAPKFSLLINDSLRQFIKEKVIAGDEETRDSTTFNKERHQRYLIQNHYYRPVVQNTYNDWFIILLKKELLDTGRTTVYITESPKEIIRYLQRAITIWAQVQDSYKGTIQVIAQ
jgi:hypothetical protein